MSSVTEDRTARARVRDAALELFAEHGEDRVTMRQVANLAGVSPALVVHHFGSKTGLRAAVVDHVRTWMDELIDSATRGHLADNMLDGEWAPIGELLAQTLPEGAAAPRYLRRLMMTGDPVATELLRTWHRRSVEIYRQWDSTGLLDAGPDVETRAALTMSADLGALFLADHWQQVLGYDPLRGDGLRRWGEEAMRTYGAIFSSPEAARSGGTPLAPEESS